MKLILALVPLVWVPWSAAHAEPLGPPIAPAAQGKMECYQPNLTAKTCWSMSSYAVDAAGKIQSTSTLMVNTSPPITMTATTPVTIKNGQVCGVLHAEDVAAAQFTVNGAPASADQAASIRQALTSAMGKMFGHELCSAYKPDGDGFIVQATDNGVAQPKADEKLIWVSPADGYKVGP
jgi:hypothetical protein